MQLTKIIIITSDNYSRQTEILLETILFLRGEKVEEYLLLV